jgi:hypothetical protein
MLKLSASICNGNRKVPGSSFTCMGFTERSSVYDSGRIRHSSAGKPAILTLRGGGGGRGFSQFPQINSDTVRPLPPHCFEFFMHNNLTIRNYENCAVWKGSIKIKNICSEFRVFPTGSCRLTRSMRDVFRTCTSLLARD